MRSTAKWVAKISAWLLITALVAAPSLLHSQFGIGFSPILTGSMSPGAEPGDVFITTTVKASTLRVGDIISIHNQVTGVFYAHRIHNIDIRNGLLRIITKGDANVEPERDPFMISGNGLVSKEVYRVKWVGRPLVYLTSAQGRNAGVSFLVIANVLALIFFLFRKEKKRSSAAEKIYRDLYAEAIATRNQEVNDLFPSMFDNQKGTPHV